MISVIQLRSDLQLVFPQDLSATDLRPESLSGGGKDGSLLLFFTVSVSFNTWMKEYRFQGQKSSKTHAFPQLLRKGIADSEKN